jgi:hypothetical protein
MPRAHGPKQPAPRVVEPEVLTREQQIYEDRLIGLSVLSIADKNRTDVSEVQAIIARMCPSISMQMKLTTIELELARLEELQTAFHAKAKSGCVQSAAILLRLSEARRQLLGLDSPLKVDAVQVRAEAAATASSVDRIHAALDRLAHGTSKPPEEPKSH